KMWTLILSGLLFLGACKKETKVINETVVDNYIYEVNPVVVYQSNIEKTRQKTSELFISGLYANLFQSPIEASTLSDLTQIRLATGDKQVADELFVNGFINAGGVDIPSNTEMRADIDRFIVETYLRFFLRMPNPYEIYELKQMIETDPDLTPELIYQGFVLSNEYKFY
ncbi:MAG: hypothetical protein D6714_04895, partial [Bacteroidetes bacterium]